MMFDDAVDVVDSVADQPGPNTADAGHDVAGAANIPADSTETAGSETGETAADDEDRDGGSSDTEGGDPPTPPAEGEGEDTRHGAGDTEAAADTDTVDATEGESDRSGILRLYNLERDIDRKIEAYQRDGKDPLDLFDPSKPDYLGTEEALAPYMESSPLRLTVHPKDQDFDLASSSAEIDPNPSYSSESDKETGGPDASADHLPLTPSNPDPFEMAATHLARSVVHNWQRPAHKQDQTADNGSFLDQLTDQLNDRLKAAGIAPSVAGPLAHVAAAAAAIHPAIASVVALHDLSKAIQNHDPIDFLISAVGLLPGGRLATSLYREARAIYFLAYPALRGKVWVHHAVPLDVLRKYPELFTVADMQSLGKFRGIPNEINRDIHLKAIGNEWRLFFKENETATKELILNKVKEIDEMYGHLFLPPRRSAK